MFGESEFSVTGLDMCSRILYIRREHGLLISSSV